MATLNGSLEVGRGKIFELSHDKKKRGPLLSIESWLFKNGILFFLIMASYNPYITGSDFCWERYLTQPMANRLKLLGIPYLVGKTKFQLLFHGPNWLSKIQLPVPMDTIPTKDWGSQCRRFIGEVCQKVIPSLKLTYIAPENR